MVIKNIKSNIVTINLKSFSPTILQFYIAFFFQLMSHKDINLKVQPIKHKHITLLRSPHKYKKAQEHFQLNIHKAVLTIKIQEISTLFFLLTNKPQGIYLNIKIKEVIN